MTVEILFIGLIISLLFISIAKFYPGGIIVPGYLALFIDQPYRLAGTILASLMVLVFYRIASRYTILFGKRRFVFMIIFGSLFAFILTYFLPFVFAGSVELRVIGWVIPGLIANNFERQGVMITISSMVIAIAATYFVSELYLIII